MDLKTRTENALLSLMVPAGSLGFQYLRTAIIKTVEDEAMVNRMTTNLYPTVAAYHKTTETGVERSVFYAVNAAYGRCDSEIWSKYFHNSKKPTSGDFIAVLAMKLRQER